MKLVAKRSVFVSLSYQVHVKVFDYIPLNKNMVKNGQVVFEKTSSNFDMQMTLDKVRK